MLERMPRAMQLGLVGRKLAHSLSVPIHERYFARIGARDGYRLVEIEPDVADRFGDFTRDNGYDGLNITMPYKQAVMNCLDELTPEAERVGAVNTVCNRGGRLIGHNTDLYGFAALLGRHGIDPRGKTCAVLGASGGAAQAALCALEGAREILPVSRAAGEGVISYEALAGRDVDLIVNCTPVGMHPHVDRSPLDPKVAARAPVVIDMIYNPRKTRLMQDARGLAVDGLYMLVAQAIAAEAFWRDEPIDRAAIDAIYEWMEGER